MEGTTPPKHIHTLILQLLVRVILGANEGRLRKKNIEMCTETKLDIPRKIVQIFQSQKLPNLAENTICTIVRPKRSETLP